MTDRARTVLTACAAIAACLAATGPAAHAGVPSTPFTVAPTAAGTSSVITASWKVDRRLRRGERFGFELSVVTPPGKNGGFSGNGSFAGAGYNCTTNSYSPARVVQKGTVLRATFRPGRTRDGQERWKTWCPGTARVLLFRYPKGDTNVSRFLGLRKVPITLAPGETVPFTATPVRITLLPGSTITATAAGRPDRSTPVTGVLRGTLDGPVNPGIDMHVISLAGALKPASFAPDPLCPGTTPPATLDAAPGTRLDTTPRGAVTFGLTLSGAPSQIFGCGPSGASAGTTTLALTGTAEPPRGLATLSVTGATPGFALPDGTQGGLAANLVVNVDLSGRG